MSLTNAASLASGLGTSSPTSTQIAYNFSTSSIVRAAVAAGIIVLSLAAIVLFFKISSWIRYNQRARRQRELAEKLIKEEQAVEYEIAAWSDDPSSLPVKVDDTPASRKKKKQEEKEKRRRGGQNAYAVYEWEGVAQ